MQSEVVDKAGPSASAHVTELALAGEISLLVHDARDLAPLDVALERLRAFTGADAGDLFLAHPDGSEVFLVSHVGEDADAFSQRVRFRLGEGIPGIVLRTGAAVWTRHLPDEIDFVRSRVIARGYRSAACVPLLTDDTVTGCVFLAWRDSKRDLRRSVRAITVASRPMATGVEIIRARLLARAARSGSEGVGGEVIPERLKSVIPTDSVQLIPTDLRSENGAVVACPACTDGSVQILGGRSGWPEACVRAGCSARARYCVRVDRGAAGWAVATLAFREQTPVPLTRHVPIALWLATSADSPLADDRNRWRPPDIARSHPHLEIRCLGGFEVLVEGRPLAHQRFGRSKAVELLALLAAMARPVAIEELERSLWPDIDASRTRNRLHVTLSALRSALETGEDSAATYIQRNGRFYVLSPHSSVEVDLWRFQDILKTASATLPGRESPDTAMRLREAIALGRQGLFGGTFTNDWVQGVDQRVRAQIRWACERLDGISESERGRLGIHHDSTSGP